MIYRLTDVVSSRVENLKDLVLYRFGSTGVVQVLSRAAELLGLTPVFPVRNIHTFTSGTGSTGPVFRDCVLVTKYAQATYSGAVIVRMLITDIGTVPLAMLRGS
jgi:ribosome-binding ATPase YchF (GTP1/OBG family)